MEKKLVVLTAVFALTAGLVFAQTLKNTGGDMAGNTEVMNNAEENNAVMNDENAENAETVEMNAEDNAEMNAEAPAMNEEMPAAK